VSRLQSLAGPLVPFAENLFRYAEYAGLNPRITSARRSRAEQEVLYQRFLKGANPYPVLPPGQSLHELGLAFDMVVDNPKFIGGWWNRLGGKWGGKTDPVHFEYRPKGMKLVKRVSDSPVGLRESLQWEFHPQDDWHHQLWLDAILGRV